MSSLGELKALGESLGLEGEKLANFVLAQQNIAREERAHEREERAAVLASEERAAARAHELELARIQASAPQADTTPAAVAWRQPRLPVFTDQEDISAYLVRFERLAVLNNIDVSEYSVRLSTLLSGKALEIYASLPVEVTDNYESLKTALLAGFNKTPEFYRTEFRTLKIGPDENFGQFSAKLSRLLDFWVSSRKVEKNYESLRSFILGDQLIASVCPELRLFLKERNALTVDEIVFQADNWSTARGGYHKARQSRGPSQALPSGGQQSSSGTAHSSSPSDRRPIPDRRCYSCGATGHLRTQCPTNPMLTQNDNVAHNVQYPLDGKLGGHEYLSSGSVNGKVAPRILRDTGCSCVIVSDRIMSDTDVSDCKKVTLYDYLGRADSFPVVRCYIECEYYTGYVDAVCAPIKFCDVLFGNCEHFNDLNESNAGTSMPTSQAVTRSQKSKVPHPLTVSKLNTTNLSPEEFLNRQKQCPTLIGIKSKADSGEIMTLRDGSQYKFVFNGGLLYRLCVKSKYCSNEGKLSLVVPADCRDTILALAHESTLAGHFSHRKTEHRIRSNFFWPTLGSDVRNFCRSCDRCQRVAPKGRTKRVPLCKMPVITEPFSRVAIDLVGPLSPPSEEGHQYILTLIDCATGFPEAVPLKLTDSIHVAEALLGIFSRVGIPREILSDRGPQFTSQLLGEIHRLLGVKPMFSSPYHPMGNSRVERLHSTLLSCLKKLCLDKPKQWHRFLVPTLFAIREMPSDRTGFSAFELLYGRQVRGPLAVLRELWSDEKLSIEQRTSFHYVLELRDKLEQCTEIAAMNASANTEKFKSYFDLKSQDRRFKVGDEVLILLPDQKQKLLLSWKGPHTVTEVRNRVNYIVDVDGKGKLYHANLLKKYHQRVRVDGKNESSETPGELSKVCHYVIINQNYHDLSAEEGWDTSPDDAILDNLPSISPCVDLSSPVLNDNLEEYQKVDVQLLCEEFDDVFSQLPGCTDTVVHKIELMTNEPVRSKVYPVPIHLRAAFDEEVDQLLSLGIIQPSSSPFRSPTIMVEKFDKSHRLILDTRALNDVTVFDAEPTCCLEEELYKFSGSKFLSEMDLTKAYHQIKLSEDSRKYTAFATNRGLMEFTRMPFGLVTACASYVRLMRIVLADIENVSFYFDNVIVYSSDWDSHMIALRLVMERLRLHNLTVKSSKCKFGFESIDYLGFVLGCDSIKPQFDKV